MTHDAAATLVLLIILAFVFLVGYAAGWVNRGRAEKHRREVTRKAIALARIQEQNDGISW